VTVLGVDPTDKHDHPDLNWQYLPSNGPVFDGEFEVHRIFGHFTQERVLYNVETKAVLGITDLLLNHTSFVGKEPFLWTLYAIGLGAWRPSIGITPNQSFLGSYHYLFAMDRIEARASYEKIRALDIQIVPLGHGGVFFGRDARNQIESCSEYLFKPDYKLSDNERWFLPISYVQNAKATKIVKYMAKSLKSSGYVVGS